MILMIFIISDDDMTASPIFFIIIGHVFIAIFKVFFGIHVELHDFAMIFVDVRRF